MTPDLQKEYTTGQIRKLSIYEGKEEEQQHFVVNAKVNIIGNLIPISSIMERIDGLDRFYYIIVEKDGVGKIWKKIVNPKSPIITYEL